VVPKIVEFAEQSHSVGPFIAARSFNGSLRGNVRTQILLVDETRHFPEQRVVIER
jgi:hypothetical protein